MIFGSVREIKNDISLDIKALNQSVLEKFERLLGDDRIQSTEKKTLITEAQIIRDVYGRSEDEFSFEFDVSDFEVQEKLALIRSTEWENLTDDERKKRLSELEEIICKKLGIDSKPKVIFFEDELYRCGAYDPIRNEISININLLDDPDEVINTITHESRHAYQFQRARHPESYMDVLYAYNFLYYISPYKDEDGYTNFTDYQDQLIEAEARAFAGLFVQEKENE